MIDRPHAKGCECEENLSIALIRYGELETAFKAATATLRYLKQDTVADGLEKQVLDQMGHKEKAPPKRG